jgi:enamine deaminase RidA (YjgF/YER057c/UK114 family)
MSSQVGRRVIDPDPERPWAVAAKAMQVGDTVYLSSQVGGVDEKFNVITDDFKAQARGALQTIDRILQAAGGSIADVVKLTLYFTSADDRNAYFEVAKEFFGDAPPAATGVVVTLLHAGLKLEIDATAVLGQSAG